MQIKITSRSNYKTKLKNIYQTESNKLNAPAKLANYITLNWQKEVFQ